MNDVSKSAFVQQGLQVVCRLVDPLRFAFDTNYVPLRVGEIPFLELAGNQDRRIDLLENVSQPFRRMTRIKRDVYTASLPNSQQGDRPMCRSFHTECHWNLWLNTPLTEL